jgi:N-acetylmuramic acid 6-phosphate etherase
MTENLFSTVSGSTEDRHPLTWNIDRVPASESVKLFIEADRAAFEAVQREAAAIARAVDIIVAGFRREGRLIYVGAGTSGRLGFLDAAECPPTFGVPPEMVVALMAGGESAMQKAVEGAEDDRDAGQEDLIHVHLQSHDVVVGITASGTTPYVRAALSYAQAHGTPTILVACNPVQDLAGVDLLINPLVGPEIISGSTRLKSGTACKMILNMLTTLSMVQIGKVYHNLMVDVVASNIKLRHRARRILMQAANIPEETAEDLLKKTGGAVKPAILMAKTGVSAPEALQTLQNHQGSLARALGEV